MALLFPHPSLHPSPHKPLSGFKIRNHLIFSFISNPRSTLPSLTSKSPTISPHFPLNKTLITTKASTPPSPPTDFAAEPDDAGGEDLAASPWEGAVVYRRDASVAHLEYCTTLERLGLGRLSTDLSRSRASAMGIRMPARRAKDSPLGDAGTPVLVSLDVARRKRRLKLDGIVRTVITLGCNRCAEPAAECVFSNFTLLLTEDPIEEPDEIKMIFGHDKSKTSTGSSSNDDEDDDERQIDLDDRLYFPSEEKEIDISKHIRDIVHVEITITAVCDASCKGLCLKCGTNLNRGTCSCGDKEDAVKGKEYGPLKSLRKQMQQS